MKGGETNGQN